MTNERSDLTSINRIAGYLKVSAGKVTINNDNVGATGKYQIHNLIHVPLVAAATPIASDFILKCFVLLNFAGDLPFGKEQNPERFRYDCKPFGTRKQRIEFWTTECDNAMLNIAMV